MAATPTPTSSAQEMPAVVWDSYPTQPPNSLVYVKGVHLVTLTHANSNVETLSMSDMLVESTSYLDAAAGSSYIAAESEWAEKYQTAAFTGMPLLWTSSTSTVANANAAAEQDVNSLAVKDPVKTSVKRVNNGSIAGIVVSVTCAVLLLLLWRRARRFGMRKMWCFGVRGGQIDEEQQGEREMSHKRDVDGSLIYASSISSTPGSSFYSDRSHESVSSLELDLPHSPASAIRRNSTRGFALSAGTTVSQAAAAKDADSLLDNSDADSMHAPSIASISTQASQRLVQSDGPYPLHSRAPGAPSFLAELARLRAQRHKPNPIVNESFLTPANGGESGENGFDWRRCSFATVEEQAMWIKARSEVDLDASLTSSAPVTIDQASDSSDAAPTDGICWRSNGLRSFAAEEDRIAYLRAAMAREASSSKASIHSTVPRASSSPRRTESSDSTSSHLNLSKNNSSCSPEDASASYDANKPLGLNAAVKNQRLEALVKGTRQRSMLSQSIDPYDSSLPLAESPTLMVSELPAHEGDPASTTNARHQL